MICEIDRAGKAMAVVEWIPSIETRAVPEQCQADWKRRSIVVAGLDLAISLHWAEMAGSSPRRSGKI
jgi:hypothetical protein